MFPTFFIVAAPMMQTAFSLHEATPVSFFFIGCPEFLTGRQGQTKFSTAVLYRSLSIVIQLGYLVRIIKICSYFSSKAATIPSPSRP